ncbi:winged helix-turn-helix domain-containing protein [Janibacter anophelis]|uniref:winged helix-turn-helix domain-containing protein n=1 Tax=Janibacter anophelis TaxID=319054 RepID=UPI003F7EAAD8
MDRIGADDRAPLRGRGRLGRRRRALRPEHGARRTGAVLRRASRQPGADLPAQGVAALWSGRGQQDDGTDIADLIGRGRREVLELLDRPRTTRDLSRLDGRAESTISYHLGVLARAGLVSKQRSGGSVGYRRTDLGDSLVTGGGRPGRRYDQSA